MTPKQFLTILRARWLMALGVLLLVVAATAAVSLTVLKRYTASASVMLDARSPDQIAGGQPNATLPGGYMATQIELITSERVARGVIRALGLDKDQTVREAWLAVGHGEGDFEAWLAEAMSKRLVVRPAPVSNVLNVEYTDDDGTHAAQLANAYVKSYIDTMLEIRAERVKQYGSFFDARAKDLRADLQAAQAKLADFQQKNGLIPGDDKLDIESTRLAELATQLTRMQGSGAAQQAPQSERSAEQLPEAMRSPAVVALSADVTREEVRMRELTARLGDSHPQVIEQQARLSEIKARLATEQGRVVSNVSIASSGYRARINQVGAALESQRAKVMRIQSQREQAAVIQRDVDNAQRAYDAMQQRVNQAAVESHNNHANVTVLKTATVPMLPSSPNVPKNIAAGLVAGTLLALLLVVGREQLDRRLRTVDDVTELKQTMLVSLPVSAHASRTGPDTSRTKLMKQRVLTGLPRPTQPTT
jgi:polysaccharide biosynthesis transport protein